MTVLTSSLDQMKIISQAVQELKMIFGPENEHKFRFKENVREPNNPHEKRAFGYTFNFR